MNMCECIHTHGSRHRCKYRLNMYRHMYIYKCVCVRAYLLPTRQHTCVCIFNLCNSAPSVSPTYAYSQCACLSIASVSRTYEREREWGQNKECMRYFHIYEHTHAHAPQHTLSPAHTHAQSHENEHIHTGLIFIRSKRWFWEMNISVEGSPFGPPEVWLPRR